MYLRMLIAGAAWMVVACAALHAETSSLADRFAPVLHSRGQQPEAERLKLLFDIDWALRLEQSPELATYVGVRTFDHRWTDLSAAALARRREIPPAALAAIRSIDRDALNEIDRVSYDLYLREAELAVAGLAFPDELLPINQLSGIHQQAANLLSMAPRTRTEDLENQLARLQSLPTVIDQVLVLLEKGLRQGITPPRIALRDVPQQVRNQVVADPLTSPLLSAFRAPPATIPGEDQLRLREAAVTTYRDHMVPAWRRLERFLEDRYLPGAREDIAWSALPQGEAWYELAVRQRTTLDLSPAEIHQIGLAEVERIRGEMERVKTQTGFTGPLTAFFEFLRTDPRFYVQTADELLLRYRDIAKRADAALPPLFGTLPRLPYGVEPVPSFAEQSQTTAYYQPGSLAAGRPGIFYANTYALSTRPTWEMEALTLHEAVPGHHLQIALQQEIEGLPAFRRFSWGLTGYVEGWGLYAESLGEEMGFYRDPYARFGQLTYEMWRAVRLVVDTGMHAKGWSRQQAIDFFKRNASKTENDIIVEIDRYIVWPGQALAYKLGELKLKELRALAERELGPRFDLREFHDQVLGQGALPLHILDQMVREWVERKRAK